MEYQRLALSDRYQIHALKKSGKGIREIGRIIGRSGSTISRELKANGGWMGYNPRPANHLSESRRNKKSSHKRIIDGKVEAIVRSKLTMEWSPEQISGWLLMHQKIKVSYSSIYRFVYQDAKRRGLLYTHLRTGRAKRKVHKKAILTANFSSLKDVRSIDKRPRVVEQKVRLGDYERDTMYGSKPGGALLTINDRVSRKVKLDILKTKCSVKIHRATVKLLRVKTVHTLTNDNGTEFARHKLTEKVLRTKIYFSHKGCAWERGANENTNGLLRQYFPRSMDFSSITKAQVQHAEDRLNNRPRKCLGYRTPNQVERILGQVLR